MNNSTKNCKVTIFGDVYSLVTSESPEHVAQAAHLVDMYMKEIAAKSAQQDDKKFAILAAVRIASKVLLLEAEQAQAHQKKELLIEAIDSELQLLSSLS